MKNNFTEKISEKLKNLDEKNRYYIFGGILLCIFLLDYFIVMRPQLGALNKINPEIKLVRDDLKLAQSNIAGLKRFQDQTGELQADLDEINLKVKSREEVPLILETVSRLANESNIKIDQIMPVPEDQELLLESNVVEYYALPISIEGRSSYHNFGKFINSIENANIILNIAEFKIFSTSEKNLHKIALTIHAIVSEEVRAQKVTP